MANQVIIANVILNPDDFPKLFQWAMINPATLEDQLVSLAKKFFEGDRDMAAASLESDLEKQ